MSNLNLRVCGTCKTTKNIESFCRSKGGKNGRNSQCRDCTKKYREDNAERLSLLRSENSGKLKAYSDEYYRKNKTKISVKRKEWRKRNRDYRVTNPYIYKIVNKVTGGVYYGSSMYTDRWIKHKSDSRSKKATGYNCPLYENMRQYGLHNFIFEVMLIVQTRERAYELEAELIREYSDLNVRGVRI